MINKTAVVNSVAAALHGKWPDMDIHQNLCPVEFERPAFLIETPRVIRKDATIDLIEETIYLTITCFGTTDDYENSDVGELAQMQTEVIELFREGFVPVADRSVKIAVSEGGMDFDRSWVDLQAHYFEQRKETTALPPMQHIFTKLKEE